MTALVTLKSALIVITGWGAAVGVAYAADHGYLHPFLGSPIWLIIFVLMLLLGALRLSTAYSRTAIIALAISSCGLATLFSAKIWVHPFDLIRLQIWLIEDGKPDAQVWVNGKSVAFKAWGSSGLFGSTLNFTLVRDDTGEVNLRSRSDEWNRVALPVFKRFSPPNCVQTIKSLDAFHFIATAAC